MMTTRVKMTLKRKASADLPPVEAKLLGERRCCVDHPTKLVLRHLVIGDERCWSPSKIYSIFPLNCLCSSSINHNCCTTFYKVWFFGCGRTLVDLRMELQWLKKRCGNTYKGYTEFTKSHLRNYHWQIHRENFVLKIFHLFHSDVFLQGHEVCLESTCPSKSQSAHTNALP